VLTYVKDWRFPVAEKTIITYPFQFRPDDTK
jgi:hypothetical protein